MSNSSDTPAQVRLIADAYMQPAEIEILDGNLDSVELESNVGRVEVDLDPGVYSVRFRIGDEFQETIKILEPGAKPTYVTLDQREPIVFETSAPLTNTRSANQAQAEAAQRLSRTDPIDGGAAGDDAGAILIFVRDPSGALREDPSAGLTLHDASGEQIVAVRDGEHHADQAWAGCHVALAEGGYRLRLDAGGTSPVEQALYVTRGWQTQVFLLAEPADDGTLARIRPSASSVLMARWEVGFTPDGDDLRWTETALRALEGGSAIPSRQHSAMLMEKFQDPLLGIYAAHLDLRRADADANLLTTVVGNLNRLMPGHPDVLAIARAAPRTPELDALITRIGEVRGPPMLRASWLRLLEASADDERPLAPHSLAAAIPDHVLPTGPWLVWRLPTEAEAIEDALPESASFIGKVKAAATEFWDKLVERGLAGSLLMVAEELKGSENARELAWSDAVTDLERRMAAYVYPEVDPVVQRMSERSPSLQRALREQAARIRRAPAVDVVRDLEMPPMKIFATAASLARKLRAAHPPKPAPPIHSARAYARIKTVLASRSSRPRSSILASDELRTKLRLTPDDVRAIAPSLEEQFSEFDIHLTPIELGESKTVRDIFGLISSKIRDAEE